MLNQVRLLKKYAIRVRGHLGQHLLMDPNTVRKIVDGLELAAGEPVLEIGPGLGALTAEFLVRGHSVIAVEKDPKFVEILQTEIAPEFPGLLEIVRGDILKCDLTKVLRERNVPLPVKAASNLPYYISTPILFHLIEHRACFHSAVLMMQKEVAARMTAKPRTEDYGRLSVSSSVFGKTQTLFDVSPKCFLPAPEVTSRVIRYVFERGHVSGEEKALLDVIRIAFSERRKTLLSLLSKQLRPEKGREELAMVFGRLGLSLNARGEELTTAQFRQLSDALK
ncbi:MAG TPA: 16S rRNA (adenine(1518)-N(6)/adenine(1519)-N(6))-dimethyltransferase RsmA [Candidatus Omnitrophota bacterium]|jgi:16S rRNA (adenine1518-N6/adenine1519-N6)-dimethyltransferase|nr:MAG: Ribosomal RNA small subunit methyltransferase A [Candidatus Omnitrophica bacterium ADurb.Bin314]HQB94110.1 16S rRNA (adenine(1518)-N(6)/adenine(1519)-N(6))-dimethyltransferase RsmA [Candidatus Omnitrophota bacterium]